MSVKTQLSKWWGERSVGKEVAALGKYLLALLLLGLVILPLLMGLAKVPFEEALWPCLRVVSLLVVVVATVGMVQLSVNFIAWRRRM
ncbi:MAG: hypothetical protein ABIP55_17125 [Tepidisphaeraceae bacterium]